MRHDNLVAGNERGVLECHARRIAASGGVWGLGTEGNPSPETVFAVAGEPVARPDEDGETFCIRAEGMYQGGCVDAPPTQLVAAASTSFDRVLVTAAVPDGVGSDAAVERVAL
jgi:hypothetical protein